MFVRGRYILLGALTVVASAGPQLHQVEERALTGMAAHSSRMLRVTWLRVELERQNAALERLTEQPRRARLTWSQCRTPRVNGLPVRLARNRSTSGPPMCQAAHRSWMQWYISAAWRRGSMPSSGLARRESSSTSGAGAVLKATG
jgi:hypothetical protein